MHRAVFGAPGIIIVVLHDHQHVVALDLLLGIEHVAADALVVTVGTLVRTGDDDGFVAAVPGVTILQLFEELPAFDRLDVGEAHFEMGDFVDAVLEHAPHERGIEKDPRLGLLAHHIVHRSVLDIAETGERRGVERRAAIGPDGRQLGAVADEHQAAVTAAADVLHEVFEQRPGAEKRPAARAVGEHRGLVDDEYRPLLGIEVERIFRFVIGIGALSVYPLVDGKSLFLSVLGEDFGRTARRGEQDGFDIQILKRPHECRYQRRFACAGIPVQHENPRKIVTCKVFGQFFYDFFLPKSCFKTNFSVNLGRNTCAEHACVIFCTKLQTNIRLA